MKFRLCFCLALLAICFAPIAVAQQVYQPMAGMPAVLPQQAPYGAYQGAPNMMPAHQAVGYNMPMVGSFQPTVQGCDSCDTCVGCDSNGCDVGNCCCGQLYDPCCPNVYLSFYGGWSDFSTPGNIAMDWLSFTQNSFSGWGVEYGTHEEFGVGFAVGRTLGRRFRTELDFTWRRGQANNMVQAQDFSAQGKVDVYSLMPNLLVDLNPNGLINVYGGVGGGIAFTNLGVESINPPAFVGEYALNDSSFAYQGIAGISARLSRRAEVFVEYRYFRTDKTEMVAVGSDPVNTDGIIMNQGEFLSQDAFVGVRISRW